MSLKLHLQFFAGGGAEGGGAEGAAEAAVGPELQAQFEKITGTKWDLAAPAPETAKKAEAPTAAETGGESAGANATPKVQEDPEKEFEALIKGKYRDQYGKRVQSAVNERFKNQRRAEKEAEELWDAIDPYLQKSGVKRGDVAGLRAAAEKDRSNFNRLAYEKGISVEEAQQEYATLRETEKKNRAQKAAEAEQQRKAEKEAREKVFDAWKADEAVIKKTDPGFSITEAIRTQPEFVKMINAGVSVKNAYRAVFYDKNMAEVAGAVYRRGKADTAQSIAARANRPVEGALGARAAATVPSASMASMSDADFDAFLRSKGLLT